MSGELAKGTRVRIRLRGRKVWRTAFVEDTPTVVGRWTLVPFSFLRHAADTPGGESWSARSHVAQVPGDEIEIVA